MRFTQLNPRLDGTLERGWVAFDCPKCFGTPGAHVIRIPVRAVKEERAWTASGEFPDNLTLSPSINIVEPVPESTTGETRTKCWHGFVTKGEIVSGG